MLYFYCRKIFLTSSNRRKTLWRYKNEIKCEMTLQLWSRSYIDKMSESNGKCINLYELLRLWNISEIPLYSLLTEFLIWFRSHGILLPMYLKDWSFLPLLKWSIDFLQEPSLNFHRHLVVQLHIFVIKFKSHFHNSQK